MTLRRLQLFVVVAEELHFNRAARRLHMAQPPLSQQIRKLEQECEVRLFERDTRTVKLTSEGQVLLVHARMVLAQYASMETAIRQARAGEAGIVRLGFVASAALHAVPLIVQALGEKYPHVELELHEQTTTPQIELIRAGQLDLGIVREVPSTPGLVVTRLQEEPLVLAVPSSHRLANRADVRLQELRGERFIAFPRHEVSRLFDHISGLLHGANVPFDVVQEAVQFPTMIGLVAARIGVAIVPACLNVLALRGVRYVRLADEGAVSRLSLISQPDIVGSALIARTTALATEAMSAR